ncbi:MAG: hypothetical protein QM719_12270 [Thermomonas sp.]
MEHIEHPSPDEQFRQEIEEARLGLRPYVSRKAAAWYLGVHHVTLSKMHCRGDGPRTVVYNPRSARNARKLYRVEDLDKWAKERGVTGEGDRRALAELLRMRHEVERLRLRAEMGELRREVARLKRRAGDVD